jgi:hypothetical protein
MIIYNGSESDWTAITTFSINGKKYNANMI